MGDISYQHFNGSVNCANGVKVEKQTKIEIHQHFFNPLEREKLHKELMALRDSDPTFFKILQDICTHLHGSYMFVKLNDTDFQKFYSIKNTLFSLYQEKECQRLSLVEEKAKCTQLQIDLAIAQNRIAEYEREVIEKKTKGVWQSIRKRLIKE